MRRQQKPWYILPIFDQKRRNLVLTPQIYTHTHTQKMPNAWLLPLKLGNAANLWACFLHKCKTALWPCCLSLKVFPDHTLGSVALAKDGTAHLMRRLGGTRQNCPHFALSNSVLQLAHKPGFPNKFCPLFLQNKVA